MRIAPDLPTVTSILRARRTSAGRAMGNPVPSRRADRLLQRARDARRLLPSERRLRRPGA